jgi:hypothetical protein
MRRKKRIQMVSLIDPATKRAMVQFRRRTGTTFSTQVEQALARFFLTAGPGARRSPETKGA